MTFILLELEDHLHHIKKVMNLKISSSDIFLRVCFNFKRVINLKMNLKIKINFKVMSFKNEIRI